MSGTVQSVRGESLIPTSLGELAEYVTSGSRDWSKYYASSGAVFIRTQDINRNRLSLDHVAHVALPERVEGKRSLVKKGDLLITITGANVGKVAAVDFDPPEAYVSQSVCLVRLKNPDLAKFVQLQLIARKGDKSALEAMAYGLGRPVLNLENIKAAPVLVGSPELHAQIVAEIEKQFSRLDEAVANLQRVKANLKRYKAAVLKAAVEGRLVETEASLAHREGRSYETGEQLLQRILEDRRKKWAGKRKYREPVKPETGSLAALPTGWAWASPEQVSAGETYSLAIGPFGSSLKVSDYKTEGVPLVFVRNIRSVSFGGENTVYVTAVKAAELAAHKVEAGDILVTKMGAPPGDVCRYPANRPPAVITADCIKLRLTKVGVDPAFIENAIASRIVQDQILGITKGVAQLKVNLANFSSIALPLPPYPEQARIVAEVDRHLSIIREFEASIDANLNRAHALRRIMLSKAFKTTLV